MKYFVTGATGFLGNVLTRQLVDAGHTVHASVRDPGKAGALQDLGVKLFPGDVTDRESMRPGVLGTDGVFHVAGWYKIGTRDKSGGERVNVRGTRNVLELMKELGIPKGVYTSTLAVNSDTHGKVVDESHRFTGTHLSEYDRSKAAAHRIAQDFIQDGLPLVIVMPGLIYGPGDTSTLRANLIDYLQGKLPLAPRRTAMSWAHVDDVAHAHRLAMDKGRAGESYIIAGEPYELTRAFDLAQEITGIPAPRKVPYQLALVLSRLMAVVEKIVPLPETYTSEGLREVAGVTYLGDNARARRDLGYQPRPLREGLKQTLEHEIALLRPK